jgi:hypothetical protein
MTAGAVILLDEVATLRGGAPTLGGALTPTLGGGVMVVGKSGGPAMMAESWRMALRCFNFLLSVVGIVCPS